MITLKMYNEKTDIPLDVRIVRVSAEGSLTPKAPNHFVQLDDANVEQAIKLKEKVFISCTGATNSVGPLSLDGTWQLKIGGEMVSQSDLTVEQLTDLMMMYELNLEVIENLPEIADPFTFKLPEGSALVMSSQAPFYVRDAENNKFTASENFDQYILTANSQSGIYKVYNSNNPEIYEEPITIVTLLEEIVSWSSFEWPSFIDNVLKYDKDELIKVPNIAPNTNNLSYLFDGALKFDDPAVSEWDTSNVHHFKCMFQDASIFNQPLPWDTSKGEDFTSMFDRAGLFNQPIDWDMSKAIFLDYMFNEAFTFNQDISSWDVSNVTLMDEFLFDATSFKQNLSGWCVTNITEEPRDFGTNSLMDLSDYPVWGTCPGNAISPMTMNATGGSVTVAVDDSSARTSDVIVDWGDGTTDTVEYGRAVSKVLTTGEHEIKITPISAIGSGLKIWGDGIHTINDFGDCEGFISSSGLVKVPTELPRSLRWLSFNNCVALNDPSISNWDVSLISNFENMFARCHSFNQPLNSWDMSNALNLQGMFSTTTENVTTTFNQPLDMWDVSKVTNMSYMFNRSSVFDQPLPWNVSSVNNMNNMFDHATSFNQDLTMWCVTNVISYPSSFNAESALITANLPIWGTCPVSDSNSAPAATS